MAGYPESKEGPPGDGMIADGLADILAVPSHRAARWRAFPALDARFPEEPTLWPGGRLRGGFWSHPEGFVPVAGVAC